MELSVASVYEVASMLGKDVARVQAGRIFGTKLGGNRPLLNSAKSLRIGWSYQWKTGEYVFRVGGTWLEKIMSNPHINLWPPSWWGGPPLP